MQKKKKKKERNHSPLVCFPNQGSGVYNTPNSHPAPDKKDVIQKYPNSVGGERAFSEIGVCVTYQKTPLYTLQKCTSQ